MALFAYEDDTWMFTVFGMAGREPPGQLAEMVAFADRLAPAHLLAAIGAAEPLTEVSRFRYPQSRWRRTTRCGRSPRGCWFSVTRFCSFNPIYGQGMTVAALQAQALRQCLRRGVDGLAQRYFRAAAKPVGVAWRFAAGGDLNLPSRRTPTALDAVDQSVRPTGQRWPPIRPRCRRTTYEGGRFRGLTHPAAAPEDHVRVATANRRRNANRDPTPLRGEPDSGPALDLVVLAASSNSRHARDHCRIHPAGQHSSQLGYPVLASEAPHPLTPLGPVLCTVRCTSA